MITFNELLKIAKIEEVAVHTSTKEQAKKVIKERNLKL